jgi:O-antigen/teichoic acid export membrane protein
VYKRQLLISLLLVAYLSRLGEFRFARFRSILKKPDTTAFFRYGSYNILAVLGAQIAFRIDTLMVGGLASLKEAGIYTIVAVLSDVIAKPAYAVRGIAGPIISDRLANDDLEHVRMVYRKSAVNLLIAGLGIFLLIWLSIRDIIGLMPNSGEMEAGIYVVLFLGMAKVIDMMTSLNSEILGYSRYYAYNLLFILVLAVLNVVTNLLLIPEFGLVGAAMATFISITLFNLIKLIFIQVKLRMQPFTISMLWTFAAGTAAYFIAWLLPLSFGSLVNLVVRSAAFSILFILPVILLRVSPDLNDMLRSKLGKWVP